jgi:hypothetical protein
MKTKEIMKEVRYLTNKPKIKTLVDEVGLEHILKYLVEYIDALDIDSSDDLWKFRVADSLEDAYDNCANRFKITEDSI